MPCTYQRTYQDERHSVKKAEILSAARVEFMTHHGELFDKHFPGDLDEEAMILKAHLLLEGALRDFCSRSVPQPEHLKGARLQFSHVLCLAQAFTMDTFNEVAQPMWAVATQLNRLRNAMAHELEPDPKKIETCKKAIVDLVHEMQDSDKKLNLRDSLEYVFGAFNAFLHITLTLRDGIKTKDDDKES